jgi:hypothetical protein
VCRNERSGSRRRVQLLQRRFDGRKPRALSADIALWLCERLRSGPFTTRGLTVELTERGIKTDRRAVWTFVRDQGLSFKKSYSPASRIALTSSENANAGRRVRPASIPPSSSTRPGSRRHDTGADRGPKGRRLVAKAPQTITLSYVAMRPDRRASAP